jgi:CBS domain containing-hemolysin-like protein
MRAPLTALVFAGELTGRFSMSLPLLIAVASAHAFTVLALKRSILTEKVARRGFHVSREYAIDPLEILFARDVMQELPAGSSAAVDAVTARPDEPLRVVVHRMAVAKVTLARVVDDGGGSAGIITLSDVLKARVRHLEEEGRHEGPVPLNVVRPLGRLLRSGGRLRA